VDGSASRALAVQLLWAAATSVALSGCGPSPDSPEPSAEGAPAETVFRNEALGLSVRHRSDRTLRDCPPFEGEPPRTNCLALGSKAGGRADPLATLELHDGALEDVARREAGFEPDATGRWMTTYGRFEPVPVQRFAGEGWTGMKAVVTCGVGDENGFHAAGGECLWAVVSDGRRAVVVSTDGLSSTEEAETMVVSLRFLQATGR
jgi:hypothetical protein